MVITMGLNRAGVWTLSILAFHLLSNSTTALRFAAPTCDEAEGKLKYETGKSYFYDYESHFDGFTSGGRSYVQPNPSMRISGNVTFTFSSKCDVLLSIQDMVIRTYGSPKGAPTASMTLGKSHMKFRFNHGMVDFIEIDSSESAWTQNIKRGILSMVQNSGLGSKLNVTQEASVYGICETSYDADFGKKRIHLTKCEGGESSDLISQGIPYHLPHSHNKQIFGFLRPAKISTCSQHLENGILTEASCAESDGGLLGMEGMRATLKYSHAATSTIDKADLAQLKLRSSLLYNFSNSFPAEKDSKVGDHIKSLLNSLKSDGSNKADIYIQLKKMIKMATNLEKFSESGDLLLDDIHRKTLYDAMAEVATDESIRVLAKLTKAAALDEITQLTFFTTIAFATKPGPTALSAMTALIKNIPKTLETLNETSVSLPQHLLLGSSGLAYQFCKHLTLGHQNCLESPEYSELVNSIADLVNIQPILSSEIVVEGIVEMQLATLQALGNLASLTPRAVKGIEGILSADASKVPEWLTIQALDAFRRHPCEANLKKRARGILEDVSRAEQIRISAYLALSKCLLPADVTSIHQLLKVQSRVAMFIGTHVRSMAGTTSPAKYRIKPDFARIQIPDTVKSVEKFSRASQYMEYSAYDDKGNAGVSGEATMLFIPKQLRPEFLSVGLTFHLFGKSFNFLEVGLSQRFQMKGEMEGDVADGMMPDWCCFDQASAAKDSYVRIFGTTIGLGLETLQDSIQTSMATILRGESSSWNLTAILPSTLLDEELTFPSLMGLPITLDLDAVKFDTAKIAFAPWKLDFMATLFQAPYDYEARLHADMAITGQAGLSLGANTPMAVGHRLKGKLNHKSTFGLELASSEKALLDVKILFPETVIDSKYFEGERFSYQDINGVFKKMRDLEPSNHRRLAQRSQTRCRECMLTGLMSCTSGSVSGDHIQYKTTLEKTDSKMNAIDLTIRPDGKDGYELVLTTPGSTVQREMKMKYAENNDGDSRQVMQFEIEAQLGKHKGKGKATWTTKFRQPGTGYYWLPHDYSVAVEFGKDSKAPAQVAKFSASSQAPTKIHLDLDITGILSANGNWTLELRHTHMDLKIKIPPAQVEITIADDLVDSPTELKHNTTHVVTNTRSHEVVTTRAASVFNGPQRSFQMDSVTTSGDKEALVAKIHVNAKFAEDYYHGENKASMRLETGDGSVHTGSVNQTNAATADSFTTDLAADFIPARASPYVYTSKVKYDWANPKHYEFQRVITVEKEFKGRFLAPFDIVVKKEVRVHQEKGKAVYHVFGRSNVTDDGRNLKRNSEMSVLVSASAEKMRVMASGFTADSAFQNNFTASVTCTNHQNSTQTSQTTFQATRFNLIGKPTVRNLFQGSVNRSVTFRHPTDFEVCEQGRVKFMNKNQVEWDQEVTFHDKEFRIYQETKEMKGGKTYDTKFLLDITAKVDYENGKMKLGFGNGHNLKPASQNELARVAILKLNSTR